MIYTSYLGNLKNIPDELTKVSIMRFTPEWATKYVDDVLLSLAPAESTLIKYQNGEIDKEQYIREFNTVLKKIKPKKLKKELDGKVLLCTCKLGKFCHRHLVADYLRENNVAVVELPIKDSLKVINVEIAETLSVKLCRENPDKIFVFGDNTIRKGKKGQAVIRDEPNAFGIITKRYPSNKYGSFLSDNKDDKMLVLKDLVKLRELAYNGKTIVFPKDGLGTGLANLGYYAPYISIMLYTFVEDNFMKYLKTDKDRKRIIIAGGRDFKDYDLLYKSVYKLVKEHDLYNPIIYTGDARGADKLGNKFAKKNKLELVKFPADWDKHGKSAGFIRNAEMANDADYLVAFWDGKSKGTKHMIDTAKKKKIKTVVVKY